MSNLTLDKIKSLQKNFDLTHEVAGNPFYTKIDENNLNELEHLAVCVLGELGEFCNILKKVTRGDFELSEVKYDLDEELVDVFIYLIKISNQFDVNLESVFLKKLEKNKSRFSKIVLNDE
ncbi:nucleotide pyrophosphohydrolase [Colwellia sp. MB02u-10]|uniref:MazG nucleotide pyrophosphohydrolase domain-containing protein n=1 Tax=Colwellia sp. MB02u-10 TaxID=2759828 RepID=UPI0015F47E2F|nr:MazG nucleotide pyrophosphohydrolase domain-containing protein [Colwellia sp. MB02u-10]MBA6343027.1 nucleotide pyrophosphohydrolase [Colwellia sp. MB02u-10]